MKGSIDWDNAYPPTPSGYQAAMMNTLNDLEETSMKRKYRATLVLAAALAVLIAMSTAALAAMNHFGILDFFGQGNPLKPMDSAESLIERDLGSAENGMLRLTIREAMYDGFGLRVVAAVEPVDKAKYAVVDDIETPAPDGLLPIVIEGATITSDNAQLDHGDIFVPSDQFVMEDGALVQSAEGILCGEAPDVIRLDYALRGESEETRLSVTFDLKNRAEPRAAKLRPLSQGEDYRIVSAQILYTPLAAYLEVTYEDESPAPPGEPFDMPDGMYYGTFSMRFFHADPNCSGLENAPAHSLSELLEHGGHPCPVCMGAPMPPSPRIMYFAPLDADGNETATWGMTSGQIGDEPNGVRTYRQITTLQTGDTLPDRMLLQPMEGSERMDAAPIECEVSAIF